MMEVDDWLACQIHGVCVSDSDSDDSYSKEEFDEEYNKLKPPAFCYESIQHNIVFVPSEVKEIKRTISVTLVNAQYGNTRFKAANNTENIGNKKKKLKPQNAIEEKIEDENLRASKKSFQELQNGNFPDNANSIFEGDSTKIKEEGIEKVNDGDTAITISKKSENLFNNDDEFRNFIKNIVYTDNVDISSFTDKQLYNAYTIHTRKNNVAQEEGLSKEKNKLSQKTKNVKKGKKEKQKVTLNKDLGDIPHQNTTKIDKRNILVNTNLDTTVTTLKKYYYLFDEEIKYFIQDIISFGNSDINSFIFKQLCKDHMAYQQIMKGNKNLDAFKNEETNNGRVIHGDISTNNTSATIFKKYNYLFDEEFASLIKDISYFYAPNVIAFIYNRLCEDCMAYELASRKYNITDNEGTNNFLFREEVQTIIRGILNFASPYINKYIYEGFYKDYLNKKWINRNSNVIKNEKTHNGTVNYKNISTKLVTMAILKSYDYLFDEEFHGFMMDILNFQNPNISYFILTKLRSEYMVYKQIIGIYSFKRELYLKNQLFEQNSFLLQLLMSDIDINFYLRTNYSPYKSQMDWANHTSNSTSSTSYKTSQRLSNFLYDKIQGVYWELASKIFENLVSQALSYLF